MQEYFYLTKKVVSYKLDGKDPFEADNMQVASKLRKCEMETTIRSPGCLWCLGLHSKEL